jgi:hypothetical protein
MIHPVGINKMPGGIIQITAWQTHHEQGAKTGKSKTHLLAS